MAAQIQTREFGNVAQIGANGFVQVRQQKFHGVSGGGRNGQSFFVEVLREEVGFFFGVELRKSDGADFQPDEIFKAVGEGQFFGGKNFMRGEAVEFVEKILRAVLAFVQAVENFAGRNVSGGERNFLAGFENQREVIVAGVCKRVFGKNRAWRDDFGNFAVGQALRLGVANLIDDNDAVALVDEFLNVSFDSLGRYAAHWKILPVRHCQTEFLRRSFGVVVEHFVEVAQPEK